MKSYEVEADFEGGGLGKHKVTFGTKKARLSFVEDIVKAYQESGASAVTITFSERVV